MADTGFPPVHIYAVNHCDQVMYFVSVLPLSWDWCNYFHALHHARTLYKLGMLLHSSPTALFVQNGIKYNVIPPQSVARQKTYGGEEWDIVADDGHNFEKIKATKDNMKFELFPPV